MNAIDRGPLGDEPARRPSIGLFAGIPHPIAVEVAGILGFDFVVIDDEQIRSDRSTSYSMILAAKRHGLRALVRLADAGPDDVVGYLGLGADGVLLPGLDSAASVRRSIAALWYPPRGGRSLGGNPGNRFALGRTWTEIGAETNASVEAHVIIETTGLLEEIDEVASIDGITSLDIGLLDLSAALGHAGELAAPPVLAAVRRIARAGAEAGKPVLCAASTADTAARLLELGVTSLLVDAVRLMSEGTSAFRRRLADLTDGLVPAVTE